MLSLLNTRIKIFFKLLTRGKIELPNRLVTFDDYKLILNYYLLDYWELKIDYINGLSGIITIRNNSSILNKQYKIMKSIIDERRMICTVSNNIVNRYLFLL